MAFILLRRSRRVCTRAYCRSVYTRHLRDPYRVDRHWWPGKRAPSAQNGLRITVYGVDLHSKYKPGLRDQESYHTILDISLDTRYLYIAQVSSDWLLIHSIYRSIAIPPSIDIERSQVSRYFDISSIEPALRGMLVPVRFFDSAIDRSVIRLLELRKVHTEARHRLDSLYRHEYCILAMHSQHSLTLTAAPTVMINDALLYYSRRHSVFCMLYSRRHSVFFMLYSRRNSVFCMLYSRRHSVGPILYSTMLYSGFPLSQKSL